MSLSNTTILSSTQANSGADAWHADTYNAVASFVYSKAFTTPVFGLLDAQPGERILDIGCGSGELTLELAKIVGPDGVVLGVDSSANMIERARKNGAAATFVADAQALQLPPSSLTRDEIAHALPHAFDYKFDAVFTNAALHWCKRDPQAVAHGAAKALRKGGRFVGEMGGYMDIVGVRAAIHSVMRKRGHDVDGLDPWYFPSAEDYQIVLEKAGFRVSHISLNPRLTPLTTDIIDWQRTFCRATIYATLNDEEAEEIMREVQESCAIDSRDASGKWTIMYCRLRFLAILD